MAHFRVAVDIGGTFTDLVLFNEQTKNVTVAKVPSTPGDLSSGIIEGLEALDLDLSEVGFFVHGTTAGLNAFLQRRGAHTALITTEGFRDVYEIGRGNRPDMYNLHYHKPKRLVRRRHIYEVPERVRHDGSIAREIDLTALDKVIDQIEAEGYESVAVCFLHAYRNPEHELRVEQVLRERLPALSVSLSHKIAPEWREYERTSTTVINAYISPSMGAYLDHLEDDVAGRGLSEPIYIMQSTGGLIPSGTAKQMAVQTIMSGPVGGTMGGTALAHELDQPNLLCIDMGGTSFDMSLIVGGQPDVTTEAELEGFPLLVPMVDIHTIGAGGGSIAREEGGGLRVGPYSAGAEPGPACYGRGGTEPTVTDANLALARVDPEYFLGGNMRLDPGLARAALVNLGERLGLTDIELADGICQVINTKMAGAIREITVERGIDPRDFYLVAFGGAGPMHAVFIAQELDISTIVIPRSPGAFSAWGMLQTDLRRDFVRSYFAPVEQSDVMTLRHTFEDLEGYAIATLEAEDTPTSGLAFVRTADLRYMGQEHFLNLSLPSELDEGNYTEIPSRFHEAHKQRYGHSNPNEHVEFVNVRVAAVSVLPKARLNPIEPTQQRSLHHTSRRNVYFDRVACDTLVYRRSDLQVGDDASGPAVIEEESCTTVVPPGCRFSVDAYANIVIQLPT